VAPDGALWFGTGAGVSRFDGPTWITYTTDDGLADNDVRSIAVSPDGALWFGTRDGVSRFDGRTWTTYTTDDGLVDKIVKSIAVAPDGALWFGTSGGVSRFDATLWFGTSLLTDTPVPATIPIPPSPTPQPVPRFDWTSYTVDDGLADNDVMSIAMAPDGVLWFGTWGGGVSRFDGQTWTTYTTDDGLPYDLVRYIAVAPDGALWVGTSGGVSHFDGHIWTTYTTDDGLAYDLVRSIAVAPDGVVWVGTRHGVSRFDGQTWTMYTTSDGLVGDHVNSIAVAPDGALWFGTWNGVSCFDGQTWTTYTTDDGLAYNVVTSIAVAPDDTLWFGTISGSGWGGVSRFDGRIWITYTTADGLASDYIASIALAPDGALWVGTDGGISRFDGRTWATYTTDDGLAGNRVNSIAMAPDGALWVGTDSGVSHTDGQVWFGTNLPTDTSVPPVTPTETPRIVVVTEEPTLAATVIPPTPAPMPGVLYNDDFSDPESGWPEDSDEISEWHYENNQYFTLVKEGGWSTWAVGTEEAFADFALEADVRQVEGPGNAPFGLIFRHPDGDNFYHFSITGNGQYTVGKLVSDEWQYVGGIGWKSSSHIRTEGATNHLKVVCQGVQIALYVNGHHLSTVSDDSFAEGKVGLIVAAAQGSDPIKVAFDNFVVSGVEAGLPKPTATPTVCSFKPSGTFRGVWQAERGRLGCALNEVKVFTAEQPFENGFMFWREDTRQIYALHSEGTWEVFHDTWTEDQPKYSCPDVAPSQSPPTPLRGFGKVWCEQLGGPTAAIGWATDRELGFPDDRWVVCERGMMLWSDQWGILVLYGDGTWQHRR
jgi:sugar lactone lactonase YvrE